MKIIYILLVLLVMFGRLSAVPANPRPVEKTQPDGTKITVCLKGDERIHWMESLNGHTLMYNNNREIVFAVHDKYGNLTSSDILYRGELSSNYSSSEQKQIQNIPVKLCYSKEQVSAMQQIRQIVDGAEKNAERNADSPNRAQGNILGTHKVLVILAEFTNKTFTYSLTDFQNLMNQVGYTAGGNTGSVRDFYRENSYGKMDIEVSVAGPISSDNSTSYYALNESRWRAWAKEVATKADELVDYSEFANNGELPNFHIIFAGYGDENIADGKQLWSHKSSFIDSLVADG
ncbi:MAG: hypothetical protein LBR45_01360, partial [Bacteroidales bacterium]|nr:hypothetical protein [Bacteroidales bacterium]